MEAPCKLTSSVNTTVPFTTTYVPSTHFWRSAVTGCAKEITEHLSNIAAPFAQTGGCCAGLQLRPGTRRRASVVPFLACSGGTLATQQGQSTPVDPTAHNVAAGAFGSTLPWRG